MNSIFSFLAEVILTLSICSIVIKYLQPFLKRVLIDLCRTEERAEFWTVFSNILLIGLPFIISLRYAPQAENLEELFFEMAQRLSGNLSGFLFAFVVIGIIVSFFALFAPKPVKNEA